MTEGYGYVPGFVPSERTITTLEVFSAGNSDLGYDVDLSLPVIGSAAARRWRRGSAGGLRPESAGGTRTGYQAIVSIQLHPRPHAVGMHVDRPKKRP